MMFLNTLFCHSSPVIAFELNEVIDVGVHLAIFTDQQNLHSMSWQKYCGDIGLEFLSCLTA